MLGDVPVPDPVPRAEQLERPVVEGRPDLPDRPGREEREEGAEHDETRRGDPTENGRVCPHQSREPERGNAHPSVP